MEAGALAPAGRGDGLVDDPQEHLQVADVVFLRPDQLLDALTVPPRPEARLGGGGIV